MLKEELKAKYNDMTSDELRESIKKLYWKIDRTEAENALLAELTEYRAIFRQTDLSAFKDNLDIWSTCDYKIKVNS